MIKLPRASNRGFEAAYAVGPADNEPANNKPIKQMSRFIGSDHRSQPQVGQGNCNRLINSRRFAEKSPLATFATGISVRPEYKETLEMPARLTLLVAAAIFAGVRKPHCTPPSLSLEA